VHWTQYLFDSFIHLLSCVDIKCSIVVILIHHSDYIAYSGYSRLSIYTWVSSSRIYIANSRRNSVFTYFGKRGVTGFSWYQSQIRLSIFEIKGPSSYR